MRLDEHRTSIDAAATALMQQRPVPRPLGPSHTTVAPAAEAAAETLAEDDEPRPLQPNCECMCGAVEELGLGIDEDGRERATAAATNRGGSSESPPWFDMRTSPQ